MDEGKAENESVPADSGLRCPGCEYNLTGVVEDRCPECGEVFDRARLLAILAGAPAPIPIWDDPSRHAVLRFVKVCFVVWFLPDRFGRGFPRRYSAVSARRFRSVVLLVAVLLPLVPVIIARDRGMLAAYFVFCTAGLTGVFACEWLLTGVFGAYLRPDQPVSDAVHDPCASESWNGLVGFFRVFILLEAALLGLGFADDLLKQPVIWKVSRTVMLFVALWWWAALAALVAVQPVSARARIEVALLIPILSGVAGLAALMTGVLAGVLSLVLMEDGLLAGIRF